MKLDNFIKQLSQIMDIHKNINGLGRLEVYIKTKDQLHMWGGTSCEPVKGIYNGFDWDSGKLIIYCEKELTEEHLTRDNVKPPIDLDNILNPELKRKVWSCQTCEEFVSNNDKYCRNCGQRLR